MGKIEGEMNNSEEIEEIEEDTLKDKYLTFHIDNQDYGIAIRHVIEIIGIQQITKIPDSPNYIKGVINLRGKVIPIMDIRLRFGIEGRDYDDRTCVIVVQLDQTSLGLVVDTVSEVVFIDENSIEPSPSQSSNGESFIEGMGKIGNEIKILLDVDQMVRNDDLIKLKTV